MLSYANTWSFLYISLEDTQLYFALEFPF
uniref:Uncharacterized protein n=1 Tax=Rhizophora mucronata TaxID=61149 RepID=A0A2P2N5J3_RHIMU